MMWKTAIFLVVNLLASAETDYVKPESGEPKAAIRAVVFDAVGTVMYPFPTVADAYQSAIDRHCGVRADADLVQKTIGDALRQRSANTDLTTSEDAEREFWAELIRTFCPSSTGFQPCFDELFQHFALADNWRCFTDVAGLIPSLHSLGVKVAIASNFDQRLHQVCEGLTELASVDCQVVSSLVGYRKPAAEFFDAVVSTTEVPAANTLMVGDDLINDILGATASGFQAALIDRSPDPVGEGLPDGVYRLSNLHKLPGLIAENNACGSGRA